MIVIRIGFDYFAIPAEHAAPLLSALPHLIPVTKEYDSDRPSGQRDFYRRSGKAAEIGIDIGAPILAAETASEEESA